MPRASTKAARKQANRVEEQEIKVTPARLRGFRATSTIQKELFDACIDSPFVIATGPAGSGKSYTMAYAACQLFTAGAIDKIVITRNPIPTGQSLGFFQGDLKVKSMIWGGPIIGTLKKILKTPNGSDGYFQYLVDKSYIEFIPIEVLKGSSFDRTVVIVEEAQECDMEVLKMLSTRIGEDSKIFFNGDLKQTNKKIGNVGFKTFVDAVKDENGYSQYVADPNDEWDTIHLPVIEFTTADIVRSPLTRKIVSMIERKGL